jgi:hypothetical protein
MVRAIPLRCRRIMSDHRIRGSRAPAAGLPAKGAGG